MTESRICLLCGEEFVGGRGEDVIPLRFADVYDSRYQGSAAEGRGFKQSVAGIDERRKRGGGLKASPTLPRALLRNVCGQRKTGNDCNGWLNDIYERPAMGYVRDVVERRRSLEGDGVLHFGRWWAKTLLLLQHPDIDWQGWEPLGSRWTEFPPHLLKSLRQVPTPPPKIRVWMCLSSPSGSARLGSNVELGMPSALQLGETTEPTWYGGLGVWLPETELHLGFHFVYLPTGEVDHPFQAAGLAIQLWPSPPSRLDLAEMPVLGPSGRRQWDRLFWTLPGWVVDGRTFHRLPTLGRDLEPPPSSLQVD